MAEQHHRIKCPKCDHVQSASNSKCSNCGHSLAKARRAKFANLNESASPVAQALATQAFLFEAGFQEVLHPRARTGKFRGKLGVPTTGKRPLRGGEFPLGNKLPSGTKGKRSPGKLEGPFTYRSGWRGYYDPGEGRYLGSDDVYKPRGFDPHTGTTHEPLDAKLRREARAETARSDPAEEHQAEIARLERAIASHEKSRGTMIFSQRVLDQQKAELRRLRRKG
jgi:hypothetical protein